MKMEVQNDFCITSNWKVIVHPKNLKKEEVKQLTLSKTWHENQLHLSTSFWKHLHRQRTMIKERDKLHEKFSRPGWEDKLCYSIKQAFITTRLLANEKFYSLSKYMLINKRAGHTLLHQIKRYLNIDFDMHSLFYVF